MLLTSYSLTSLRYVSVSRKLLAWEARVRSRVIPRETCVGHSGTGTTFSPSKTALPCQCRSINATYSSSSLLTEGRAGEAWDSVNNTASEDSCFLVCDAA